jgi:dienelactone hydrolase
MEALVLADMKNYPVLDPDDVRTVAHRSEAGCERSLLVVQTPFGARRMAELFRPQGAGPFPALLYVHWYEPAAPDSNRSQFVQEALEMAARGAMCLAVETVWSDPDFFHKRTQADDLNSSLQEVTNLRRFMDLLLDQTGADPGRFALVGHDFGGMYGVLAGGLDRRPSHYVIMAATPRFPDWYLYAPKLEGSRREAFIEEMAELDPIKHAAGLAPAALLFQFGTEDPHVPRQRAEQFFEAASQPKEIKFYECGHGLNEEARRDREAWLVRQLHLRA